jgi:hypothetical protein
VLRCSHSVAVWGSEVLHYVGDKEQEPRRSGKELIVSRRVLGTIVCLFTAHIDCFSLFFFKEQHSPCAVGQKEWRSSEASVSGGCAARTAADGFMLACEGERDHRVAQVLSQRHGPLDPGVVLQ